MSFSTEQKSHIIAQPIKSKCCKKALLLGVLASRGALNGDEITVVVDSRGTAEFIAGLFSELYKKDAAIGTLPSGGRGYTVRLVQSELAGRVSRFLSGGAEPYEMKCQLCQGHFLQGVFIASGRMTDPTKQYMLEFFVKSATDRFVELFADIGLDPKISLKPHETVIYFRNSTTIEDFFALAGMNQATFALMNAKIQGEIRNNVNRVANCETNNINKAVSASAGQIAVIAELIRTGLISRLPDELQKTAVLRMEHSDLSLSQLAALITPYISKPGLSHRLKRITEIGRELLTGSKKK